MKRSCHSRAIGLVSCPPGPKLPISHLCIMLGEDAQKQSKMHSEGEFLCHMRPELCYKQLLQTNVLTFKLVSLYEPSSTCMSVERSFPRCRHVEYQSLLGCTPLLFMWALNSYREHYYNILCPFCREIEAPRKLQPVVVPPHSPVPQPQMNSFPSSGFVQV